MPGLLVALLIAVLVYLVTGSWLATLLVLLVLGLVGWFGWGAYDGRRRY